MYKGRRNAPLNSAAHIISPSSHKMKFTSVFIAIGLAICQLAAAAPKVCTVNFLLCSSRLTAVH
jgi:hypothetical protein